MLGDETMTMTTDVSVPASVLAPVLLPVPLTQLRSVESAVAPHAVSRLRTARLARSTRPFLARGGPKGERCEGCRLRPSHCMCALRPELTTRAAFCVLMHDAEPLQPSNTGWLIADVVRETYAFGWSRTEVDPQIEALLADPQWQPYVVFPGEYAQSPERVVQSLSASATPRTGVEPEGLQLGKRPLFILLDATWSEARKMFRKSPYLDGFPVLSLHPDLLSRYQLRRSKRDDHFCTSEVAALCLELVGDAPDVHAGQVLESYLGVFTERYLQAKHQQNADEASSAHQRLRELMGSAP